MMNNTKWFLIKLSIVLFGCYAVIVSAAPNPASTAYVNSTMIGQAAQGGVVFFTYLSDGEVHGLVAAKADEPGGAAYTQAQAITQCAHKNDGGYTDWFLPNKAQATALFNNRFVMNPNNFNGRFADTGDASYYWSSSAVTGAAGNGWVQDFGLGSQVNDVAVFVFSARCVRAF